MVLIILSNTIKFYLCLIYRSNISFIKLNISRNLIFFFQMFLQSQSRMERRAVTQATRQKLSRREKSKPLRKVKKKKTKTKNPKMRTRPRVRKTKIKNLATSKKSFSFRIWASPSKSSVLAPNLSTFKFPAWNLFRLIYL